MMLLRRRTLSSAEAEKIADGLRVFLDAALLRKLVKQGVDKLEGEKFSLIIIGPYVFIMRENTLAPALGKTNSEILDRLPSVWVDRGAVAKVASGADVMRPGITRMDHFKKADVVVVRDENHSQPIAVGLALTSSGEASGALKGKVVKNIHHVDDAVWRTVKNM